MRNKIYLSTVGRTCFGMFQTIYRLERQLNAQQANLEGFGMERDFLKSQIQAEKRKREDVERTNADLQKRVSSWNSLIV